jgi:hypothetical protein
LPNSCDPTPDEDINNSDHDDDSYMNRGDNCPLVANGPAQAHNQTDTDGDDIGDACDTNPTTPDGEAIERWITSTVTIKYGPGEAPPLSSVAAGTDVYAFGLDSGNNPWYNRRSGGSWGGWQGLGGKLTGSLSAVAAGSDVYVFGLDSGNNPWYNRRSGDRWGGWQGLDGKLTGRLSCAATASNDVYVFGLDAGANPWYKHWNGTSWEAWAGLGGILAP